MSIKADRKDVFGRKKQQIKISEIQNEICVKYYLSASYKHCADMVFQYRSAWISDDKPHEKAIPSV